MLLCRGPRNGEDLPGVNRAPGKNGEGAVGGHTGDATHSSTSTATLSVAAEIQGEVTGATAIVKQGDFCVSDSHDAYLAKSIARWLRELSQKRAQWLFVDTQHEMQCPALQAGLQVLIMLGGV